MRRLVEIVMLGIGASPGEASGGAPPEPELETRRRFRGLLRWLKRLAVLGLGCFLLLLVAGGLLLTVWLNLRPSQGPDVLLITIDTQRPDGLSCYGGAPGQTPNLDRIASRGVLFEQAVVSIPRTTQNVTSLLTGLEPLDHGVRELYDRVPDEAVTLAEQLKSMGYRTAAFVGGGPLGADQNIYQGFDHVDVHAYAEQVRALSKVLSASLWVTRNSSSPWFTWVHVYDPHFYYAPPWPFYDRGDPELPAISELYEKLGTGKGSFGELHYRNSLTDGQRRYLRDLYDGEARSVDFAIGLLLKLVRLFEMLDGDRRTLVVVTSDHGEGLGEHGCWYNHGAYLYDEDLLVPLLISLPGSLPEGDRVPYQVRTIDVYPTMLDLLGSPTPTETPGASLLPMVEGDETEDRIAFAESDTNRHPQNPRFHYEDGIVGRWRAVRDGRFKLIRIPKPEGDLFELYDLGSDEGETRNLAEVDRENLTRLMLLLAEWETRPSYLGAIPQPEVPEDVLDDRLEQLRSLGYVN